MEERRKFVRVLSELRLRYRPVDAAAAKESSAQEIGGGGLRFITTERLDEGQSLAFDIDVPGSQSAVSAEAEVIWVEDIGGGCWEVGTRFTRIDHRDRDKIMKHVYDASRDGVE